MIESFLTSKNQREDSNTLSVKKALIGEEVISVLQIDEDTTLFLCKSLCSFAVKSDGVFIIFCKENTKEILNKVKELTLPFVDLYNNLKEINIDSQPKEPNGEVSSNVR